jgi:hypothetical protein
VRGRLLDLVAHHAFRDARFVRQPIRELIALGRIRNVAATASMSFKNARRPSGRCTSYFA